MILFKQILEAIDGKRALDNIIKQNKPMPDKATRFAEYEKRRMAGQQEPDIKTRYKNVFDQAKKLNRSPKDILKHWNELTKAIHDEHNKRKSFDKQREVTNALLSVARKHGMKSQVIRANKPDGTIYTRLKSPADKNKIEIRIANHPPKTDEQGNIIGGFNKTTKSRHKLGNRFSIRAGVDPKNRPINPKVELDAKTALSLLGR